MTATRVLLIEHNPSLSTLLTQAFSSEQAIELIGQVSQVTHALALLASQRPDIIVMDVLLPDMGVLEAISLAIEKSPQSKIILLADRDEARYYKSAARYGATACIRKDHIATQLIPIVKQVAHQARQMKVLGGYMTRAHREPGLATFSKIQKPEISYPSKEASVSDVPV